MVEIEQGVGVRSGIEENTYSIGPTGGIREFRIGEDVPSLASVPQYYVPYDYASYAKTQFKCPTKVRLDDDTDSSASPPPGSYIVIKIHSDFLQYDRTARANMKAYDKLKEELASYDRSAGPIYDGEFKSISAMRDNGMSLTMTPTPITGRSSANSGEDRYLFLDSGACASVVFNRELLKNLRDPPLGMNRFVGADGSPMAVTGYGDIEMENFIIPNVYLVQGLIVNLISVGQLASDHKVCCCFAGNECNLMLADGRQIGGAIRRDDNQYLLRFLEIE